MSPWRRVSLTSLVQNVASWNPGIEGRDKLIEYIDISSIDREQRQITNTTKMPGQDAPSRARQLVKKDDLLVSTVRPNLNAVAQVPKELDGATASTGFCVLRVKDELLVPRYLYYWLRTNEFIDSMMLQATGASYPAVTDRIVKSSQIPLPPLSEQRRLAAILDAADGLRAKRRAALGKLDRLGQAVFWEMFGEVGGNEKGWPVVELRDVCTKITDGTHQPPKWAESGIPFLFVSNVVNGELNFDTAKFISLETYEELHRRSPIELGDILFTIVGSYGNAAMVETEHLFSFQRHIAHLKPDTRKVIPAFLLGMLQSSGVKRQVDGLVRGVAQKTLNLRELKEVKILLPDQEAQEHYRCVRTGIDEQRQRLNSAVDQVDRLFISLQQRVFKCELQIGID